MEPFQASKWHHGRKVVAGVAYPTPVKILSLEGPLPRNVVGVHDGTLEQWYPDGVYRTDRERSPLDLYFAPEKHEYPNGGERDV